MSENKTDKKDINWGAKEKRELVEAILSLKNKDESDIFIPVNNIDQP